MSDSIWDRLHRFVLRTLAVAARIATKPFASAESLEAYSDRGYLFLGAALVLVVLVAALLGLDEGAAASFPIATGILSDFASQHPYLQYFGNIRVLLVPLFLYIVGIGMVGVRRWVGERFARFLFIFLDGVLDVGEWFLERRWISFFTIIALVSGLTFGFLRFFEDRRLEYEVRRNYEAWIAEAQEFIGESTLTKPDAAAFLHIERHWSDAFASAYASVPTSCLSGILRRLNSEGPPVVWAERLTGVRDYVADAVECQLDRKPTGRDPEHARVTGLIHLLMARVEIRLAGRTGGGQPLSAAIAWLGRLNAESIGLDTREWFVREAANTRGTVFANAFSRHLSSSEKPQSVVDICGTPLDCLLIALRDYANGAAASTPCSFRDKRGRNNRTDLLMRTGVNYREVTASGSAMPDWLVSRSALNLELGSSIRSILECVNSSPFIPTLMVTAAQAFATSASLDPSKATAFVEAGKYASLANLLEPQDQSGWDVAPYFCAAVLPDGIHAGFVMGFTAAGTSGATQKLLQRITDQCRQRN